MDEGCKIDVQFVGMVEVRVTAERWITKTGDMQNVSSSCANCLPRVVGLQRQAN